MMFFFFACEKFTSRDLNKKKQKKPQASTFDNSIISDIFVTLFQLYAR